MHVRELTLTLELPASCRDAPVEPVEFFLCCIQSSEASVHGFRCGTTLLAPVDHLHSFRCELSNAAARDTLSYVKPGNVRSPKPTIDVSAIKIADQWSRVVVLRLRRFHTSRGPGLLLPIIRHHSLLDRHAGPAIYADNPTAFHLRAMNMLYEGLKQSSTIVIVPSTAAESMQLGSLAGADCVDDEARATG